VRVIDPTGDVSRTMTDEKRPSLGPMRRARPHTPEEAAAAAVRRAELRARAKAERAAAEPDVETAPVEAATTFIDWNTFWQRDHNAADWLYDPVLARGRGHSIYAAHKVGKSLLTLWIALQLAQRPDVAVAYVDYEMTENDVHERLEEMGAGPDMDLSRLHYALLPSLPPLDTKAGAEAMERIVNTVASFHPGAELAVVIDTMGRAVAGEENSADTIRAFYRHTGLMLKQRGVTYVRLDHQGKDAARGQRGTSSKGDDVDVVWHLTRSDKGIRLHRDVARMNWVPEDVHLTQLDEPLRFVHTVGSWPAGTKETADLLDQLGVPEDHGYRLAASALKEASEPRRAEVIRAAVRYRRGRPTDGTHPGTHPNESDGTHPSDAPIGNQR
jgi:KaiC/GvpD/RAD55 family RecA-like ATPase